MALPVGVINAGWLEEHLSGVDDFTLITDPDQVTGYVKGGMVFPIIVDGRDEHFGSYAHRLAGLNPPMLAVVVDRTDDSLSCVQVSAGASLADIFTRLNLPTGVLPAGASTWLVPAKTPVFDSWAALARKPESQDGEAISAIGAPVESAPEVASKPAQPAQPTAPVAQPVVANPVAPASVSASVVTPEPVNQPGLNSYSAGSSDPVPGVSSGYGATVSSNFYTRSPACPVLVVFAGKGGVGKTTFSQGIALQAATGGLRTILVDGNAGQADGKKFLHMKNRPTPSVLDGIISPASAICSANVINQARPGLEPVPGRFAFVPGPASSNQVRPERIDEAYQSVINFAAENADLVVVDTQIIESTFTPLYENVLIPIMRSGGFGLGITDTSVAGPGNLVRVLARLVGKQHVPPNRIFTLMNLCGADEDINEAVLATGLGRYSTFLGVDDASEDLKQYMNDGGLAGTGPADLPGMRKVLARMFPRQFATPQPQAGRQGLLSRLFGGRK